MMSIPLIFFLCVLAVSFPPAAATQGSTAAVPRNVSIDPKRQSMAAITTTRPILRAISDPPNEMFIQKCLTLMEQSIYVTQGNIKRMEQILAPYSKSMRYRMAHIFLKIDKMKHEMHVMWSYLYKNFNHPSDDMGFLTWVANKFITQVHRFNVRTHMNYYSYFLRKNVDISYAIEYLRVLYKVEKKSNPNNS